MDLKLYETAGVPKSVRTFALQAERLMFESHPRQTEVEKQVGGAPLSNAWHGSSEMTITNKRIPHGTPKNIRCSMAMNAEHK